jgi:hypothetical protein
MNGRMIALTPSRSYSKPGALAYNVNRLLRALNP